MLRAALATRYTIRYYTYIDRDGISRHIARGVLLQLQLHYPGQLPEAAIIFLYEFYLLENIHSSVNRMPTVNKAGEPV